MDKSFFRLSINTAVGIGKVSLSEEKSALRVFGSYHWTCNVNIIESL